MDFTALHVMVVEDHDFQRRMVVQMLQHLGVGQISDASDGESALVRLRALRDPPDVVISDLDMPGMDGVEFIRHMAEGQLAGALAIVSVHDLAMLHSVEIMAREFGLQVLGVMEKPITAKGLTEVLGYYQGQSRRRQPAPELDELSRSQIHQGLSSSEFIPHFQPKIDLRTGRVCGMEALARWQREAAEVASPLRFIPAMERAELMDALTAHILLRASQAQKRWNDAGLPLAVAVNVSMSSLSDTRTADRFLQLAREADADPHRLTLEITESVVMKDPGRVLNVLARLRLRGFGMAIDDFGTGYSTLQQLSTIPFTELKIDKAFVHGAVHDTRKRTMLETSLELARKLKLKTVAEGAETRAEWDLLVSLGCDQVQGWFIAKAMPEEEVAAWVRDWRPPGF